MSNEQDNDRLDIKVVKCIIKPDQVTLTNRVYSYNALAKATDHVELPLAVTSCMHQAKGIDILSSIINDRVGEVVGFTLTEKFWNIHVKAINGNSKVSLDELIKSGCQLTPVSIVKEKLREDGAILVTDMVIGYFAFIPIDNEGNAI